MRIATLYFTESGRTISNLLRRQLDHGVDEFGKDRVKGRLGQVVKRLFKEYDGLVFISSTGIAVRMIAPHIKGKTEDPAVIVVDDMGRFTVSLLSGHIGGANELSREISEVLNNISVITTASDNRGIDAVDLFAMRNDLDIDDMEQAKLVTSLMVDGKAIRLISNDGFDLKYSNIVTDEEAEYHGTIGIAPFKGRADVEKPFCILRPRSVNVGIGCRRGKSRDQIMTLIRKVFKEHKLSIDSISNIGTIDLKADEEGILEVAEYLKAKLTIFSKKEIERVQDKFRGSEFVKSQVGVTSVCEPSAYLLGERLIVEKESLDGVTVAVSKGTRIRRD